MPTRLVDAGLIGVFTLAITESDILRFFSKSDRH
jgi:hypothetical protein